MLNKTEIVNGEVVYTYGLLNLDEISTTATNYFRDRANHTGTQSADTITDGVTNKAFTATEKTKLAGIEANATADMTASEILTAVKTVDGSGSGLDADTLDGQHASAFTTTAGAGLSKTGSQFDVLYDNSTIGLDANGKLKVLTSASLTRWSESENTASTASIWRPINNNDVSIEPQNGGNFILNSSFTRGGNYTVDFQTETSGNNVANGTHQFLGTTANSYLANNANYSSIVAGQANSIIASLYSFIPAGENCVIAPHRYRLTTNPQFNLAHGYYARVMMYGQRGYAANISAGKEPGSHQDFDVQYAGYTGETSTYTEIFLDNGVNSERLFVPYGHTYLCEIRLVARLATDTTTSGAGWLTHRLSFLISFSDTTSLLEMNPATVEAYADYYLNMSLCKAKIEVVNNVLVFSVKNENSLPTYWTAHLRAVEVGIRNAKNDY